MRPGQKPAIKHITRNARALVKTLHFGLNIHTLHRNTAAEVLQLVEMGRVRLHTARSLLTDEYRRDRLTGGFILIDESTFETVAAGTTE